MADLIECPARLLWQSVDACAADWRRAQSVRPQPWESRWHCRGCPSGARRAGRPEAADRVAMIDGVRRICVRCHQPSDRIIGGRFCISCYNRHRELLAGCNAKGARPSVLSVRYPLHTVWIRYKSVSSNKATWEWRRPVDSVATSVEAALILLRAVGQPLYLSRSPASTTPQLTMWGGC